MQQRSGSSGPSVAADGSLPPTRRTTSWRRACCQRGQAPRKGQADHWPLLRQRAASPHIRRRDCQAEQQWPSAQGLALSAWRAVRERAKALPSDLEQHRRDAAFVTRARRTSARAGSSPPRRRCTTRQGDWPARAARRRAGAVAPKLQGCGRQGRERPPGWGKRPADPAQGRQGRLQDP